MLMQMEKIMRLDEEEASEETKRRKARKEME